MDLADHIRRIQSWEPLDWTEAIQRTLLRCYPPRETALRPSRQQPVARWFDEQVWAAGLEASGLVAIAEHLYPMELAQRQ